MLTLGSNSWQALFADVVVSHFPYNPRNNSMFALVITQYSEFPEIQRAYFNAGEREIQDLLKVDLGRGSCPQSIHRDYESTPSKKT